MRRPGLTKEQKLTTVGDQAHELECAALTLAYGNAVPAKDRRRLAR